MLWKRWIAALLSAVLLVCCMPALAEEGASLIEEEEEIDVSEMVKVDDLAANGKLDDKGWWNILLLGGDSREDGSYGRTDAIIILSVNPSTNEVKLTSVMRDIYVQMYGAGSNRINAACRLGGPELVMRTINETLGMNLVDYALVNMAAFKDIVDILGGIELNVEEREVASINEQQYYNLRELGLEPVYEKLETFGEGTKLDGNQALAYVRLRHIDSDMARTGRQRDALVAIAKKLQQEGTITTIASIALTLLSYVETNLSLQEILQLCGIGFQLDMDAVEQLRLPLDGTYQFATINGASVIQMNNEANAQALYAYIYEGVNPQK